MIFGTTLDIQFKGGVMLEYAYSGTIDTSAVESAVESATGQNADVRVYENLADANGNPENSLSITFAGTDSITVEQQEEIANQIAQAYPDANLRIEETSSVDRTVGTTFFAKCLVAVAITFVLLVIYIASASVKSAALRRALSRLSHCCMTLCSFISRSLCSACRSTIISSP